MENYNRLNLIQIQWAKIIPESQKIEIIMKMTKMKLLEFLWNKKTHMNIVEIKIVINSKIITKTKEINIIKITKKEKKSLIVIISTRMIKRKNVYL